jgi:hypothetical protein
MNEQTVAEEEQSIVNTQANIVDQEKVSALNAAAAREPQ